MKVYSQSDFKEMPWKNGGGITKELYRLPNKDTFYLRISIAKVESNGPFSEFPGVDRALLVLKGNGFKLSFPEKVVLLNSDTPIYFKGEEAVFCTLINGSSIDFNVMTDRNFGESKVSLIEIAENESRLFTASCPLFFLYDKDEEKLYELKAGESFELKGTKAKRLIRIDVNLI